MLLISTGQIKAIFIFNSQLQLDLLISRKKDDEMVVSDKINSKRLR